MGSKRRKHEKFINFSEVGKDLIFVRISRIEGNEVCFPIEYSWEQFHIIWKCHESTSEMLSVKRDYILTLNSDDSLVLNDQSYSARVYRVIQGGP